MRAHTQIHTHAHLHARTHTSTHTHTMRTAEPEVGSPTSGSRRKRRSSALEEDEDGDKRGQGDVGEAEKRARTEPRKVCVSGRA